MALEEARPTEGAWFAVWFPIALEVKPNRVRIARRGCRALGLHWTYACMCLSARDAPVDTSALIERATRHGERFKILVVVMSLCEPVLSFLIAKKKEVEGKLQSSNRVCSLQTRSCRIQKGAHAVGTSRARVQVPSESPPPFAVFGIIRAVPVKRPSGCL